MDNCKKRFEFFMNIDLFGKEPNLYYERNKKKTSYIGFVFTIIYIIIYIIFFLYKIIRMAKRVDVTFYDTYAYKDFPSIKLTNEEFYGGFRMGERIDETLYYATAEYVTRVKEQGEWKDTVQNLEVERCKLEKFGSKYKALFADQPLNDLYCMKNVNITLEGYANLDRFSYINVKVFPCVNQTRDGEKCKDINTIAKFFAANTIEFKMEDNLLSPEIYKTPVEPLRKDINAPVFLTVYQKIYSYIQIVFIETDDDITGLNFLAKSKVEKYPKYDNSQLIAAPGTADILKTGKAVCDITMQLHQKILTTRRKYTTLLEVLGDVGGLMELIYSFFNLICSFITEIIYEKSLINNLFSFDINKKVINIKNNKKIGINTYSTNSIQNLKKVESIKDRNSLSDLKKDIEIYNKERDYKVITKNYRKMSTRSKIKTNYSSKGLKKSSNDKLNMNSNDLNNLNQNSNDLYINSKYSRNDSNENQKNSELKIEPIENTTSVIENININPLFLYCLNKKRNIQKLLFEEGNKLLAINLDIMNIFDKLYLVEKMQKNLNIEGNNIEMGDNLKRNIEHIRNYYLLCT